ncbi:MAG: hypothetical protein BWY17_04020 [Deltaproteobacteria bacterium ADurb.Bin207]|nr:MAG: hypothetical protein BWY17_04020 [Deltaproteobacteria bacterium ADurb.Bin207]
MVSSARLVLLLGWDSRPRIAGCALRGKEASSRDANGLSAYFDTWSVVFRLVDRCSCIVTVFVCRAPWP